MKWNNTVAIAICSLLFYNCGTTKQQDSQEKEIIRAESTLDSLYKYYSVTDSKLLRETFPFNENHKATYLASEQHNEPNQYSFLWPYSGTFSAVNALLEATGNKNYHSLLDDQVLEGLEKYFDTKRTPAAYSSYINTAPESDRFYDDNIWLGIDFTDTYMITKEVKYLDKAKLIWKFIESGTDEKLGGGIYWCEQKKTSKNGCSNAPGTVYALKLFEATGDSLFFKQGKSLYEWTYKNLRDSVDNLYFDNINLEGKVDKAKYSYNSGQMIQAAALLYKLTKEKSYLLDAQKIAESSYSHFFDEFETPDGNKFRLLKKRDIWFTAVMLRGFIELFYLDKNPVYIDIFYLNLNYAWDKMRDENGLFNTDWSGVVKDDSKWLLTQAAMVEMYARIAMVKMKK